LQLKPETYAAVQARGLRVLFRLNLPPGAYGLRAAVNDTGSGAIGTGFYDVQVPEFHKSPLTISGLAIAAPSAAGIPTPRMDPVFEGALPSAPTATRTFSSDETLTLFFEVYRQASAGAAPVDLSTTVLDADGRVVFRSQDQVGGDKVQGGDTGFGYTVQVPLAQVPPGVCTLRVEARSRTSAGLAVVREVPFIVGAPRPQER
jgi:hypothetical protein